MELFCDSYRSANPLRASMNRSKDLERLSEVDDEEIVEDDENTTFKTEELKQQEDGRERHFNQSRLNRNCTPWYRGHVEVIPPGCNSME